MRQIVINVLSDNSSLRIQAQEKTTDTQRVEGSEKAKKPRAPRLKSIDQITCPVCGKGHIVKGRTAYGCSMFAGGCAFRLPFEECPADSTSAQVNKAIKKKYK